MKSEDRQKQILELLSKREFLRTNDIIGQLSSSPATIRRDIVQMQEEGLIRKVRGKIFLQAPNKIPSFDLRGMLNDEEKNAIGRAAASLVQEGDSIIIDSGTTTLALAGQLRDYQRLSVITNSIPAAYMFNDTAVSTFVCGGMMVDMALVDNDAIDYFANRRVKKLFLGATGVRGVEGLTVSSSYQYAVKRRMIESAEEIYALIDTSKFSFLGITLFCDFGELTGLVTSKPIQSEPLLERFDKLGLKVIYSDAPAGA